MHKTKMKMKKYNKNKTRKIGGEITTELIYRHINSIGFEIETTYITKLTLIKDKNNIPIFINSNLSNLDLDYGYNTPNEYVYLINEPYSKVMITNDSADDTLFNEEINKIINEYSNCSHPIFQIYIPKNDYLLRDTYDIQFYESDEIKNCSTFTDVEWIATYYKPEKSKNIILEHFFKTMINIKEHLSKLITINDAHIIMYDTKNIAIEKDIDQLYYLPNTSLVYFNTSFSDKQDFNITEDLVFVPQMTFGVNINYVFKIMKKLLEIKENTKDIIDLNIWNKNKLDENISYKEMKEFIYDNVNDIRDSESYYLIKSLSLVNLLFENYNKNNIDDKFQNDIPELKNYLFLIIYRLTIYLNVFLYQYDIKPETLLKKSMSFQTRHSNYLLYLEMKKIIKTMFINKWKTQNLTEEQINDKIINIILNLVDDSILNNFIYETNYTISKRKIVSVPNEDIGNPLYSVNEYFQYFENVYEEEEEEEEHDWLIINSYDIISTKYEITNDNIIIEFRDFPKYCYIELFINGNKYIQEQILNMNFGELNMKIISDYLDSKKSQDNNL
jgi:hypothetical protein